MSSENDVNQVDQQVAKKRSAEEEQDCRTALVFGALLHDVGKVLYRGTVGDGSRHSKQGVTFLTHEVAVINAAYETNTYIGKSIAEQVGFHHADDIKAAHIPVDSLAYITYFADNISAGMDRKNEGDKKEQADFDPTVELRKIFNILNGHHDDNTIAHEDYNSIRERLRQNLIEIPVNWQHVNSLITMLEATLDKVPSSTDKKQLVDVSLFDHAKTTAAIATCLYDYLSEQEISNFKRALFDTKTAPEYYAKDMFLLYTCDMSGIQDFIYTISGSGALKQLRARSLYLELLLEHIVDELLEQLKLSRANLLYTGGGHAYLLLPNTNAAKKSLVSFEQGLRAWFLKTFHTDLFVASAFVECSSDDLSNKGSDNQRFRNLFRLLSTKLSEKKAHRYTAQEIKNLNFGQSGKVDHSRECQECHRSDVQLVSVKDYDSDETQTLCSTCAALRKISAAFVKKNVFAVMDAHDVADIESNEAAGQKDAIIKTDTATNNRNAANEDNFRGLTLPFDAALHMYSEPTYLQQRPKVRRVYVKNDWKTGIKLATNIWMGDYTAAVDDKKKGISDYAERGVSIPRAQNGDVLGVKRLGVLRADVDNLGTVFVNGLPDGKISISRTAALSRSLSYFFKSKINDVLKQGDYRVQIIYSGGDDLFLIGNWDDVIYAAIAIRNAFSEFVGNGTLTLSAGIGIYAENYPIARMARETGSLEDAAKCYPATEAVPTKNAVALWSKDVVFSWDEFANEVEPLKLSMHEMFDENEKGKAFIYKLIALMRNLEEPISAPRLAYLLARSFEDGKQEEISHEFYRLAMDPQTRRQLIMALEWYVYEIRERG